jgi:hypothetical protein
MKEVIFIDCSIEVLGKFGCVGISWLLEPGIMYNMKSASTKRLQATRRWPVVQINALEHLSR